VLDLDGFKQANDLYGHVTGNRVLQEIANGLKDCCRRTDHVARLGGDEFVLVLPEADSACVAAVLQRIRDLGPQAGMKVCGTPLITISSGVATYPADGVDPEILLEKADLSMYEAKKQAKRVRGEFVLADLGNALAGEKPAEAFEEIRA